MKVLVLKGFRYRTAENQNGAWAEAGDTPELTDPSIDIEGLRNEGYIDDLPEEDEGDAEQVEIPEGWESLADKDLKALAAHFGKFKTKGERLAAIKAEVERRAAGGQ